MNNFHPTQRRFFKASCRKHAPNLTQTHVPEIHAASKRPWRSTFQCVNTTVRVASVADGLGMQMAASDQLSEPAEEGDADEA